MVSAPVLEDALNEALPTEFTLHLGPTSATQVAMLANMLRDLGATVNIAPDGSLTATRPQ